MRVLMLYDVPGWAWWHRVKNIRDNMPASIQVEMARLGEPFQHRAYDYVIIFEAMFYDVVAEVPAEKLIVGCSCPKLVEQLLEVLAARRPAAALVNNAAMHETVSRHYLCYCCPNGVDHELFTPAPALPPQLRACWVGSTRSFVDKGLDLLKGVCARLDVPLEAVDQARSIGRRRLYSHEQLRDQVYRPSSVYLCASECEGTPNPALEALACGVPVVTTRVGNMSEVIRDGDNGLLVERHQDAFAEALLRLQSSDRARMGRLARESILRGWTWAEQARRYEEMLLDLRRRRGA